MEQKQLRDLLEQLQRGSLDVEAVLSKLPPPAVVDIEYAHVDLHRRERCGFPEVIFCEGKTPEWVAGVVKQLIGAGQHCLATRVNEAQAVFLAEEFPDGQQDRIARTFWLPAGAISEPIGKVMVITAGTSDLPVAREAVVTASSQGCNVELIADVGVAGIHRLLRHRERFAGADV
ncbi:MAG: 1-(5-phosphoribosyl)-5-amino-4-imidazole-carboxylate carboxylase, partial [Gemmataceae bacterium]